MNDPPVQPPMDVEARVAEDVDHPAVVGEHVRVERLDPMLARDERKTLEELRAKPASLQGIRNRERYLGALRFTIAAVVSRQRANGAADFADQGELILVVDRRQLRRPLAVDARHVEEPEVQALR